MKMQTADESQKRLANPLDHNANRVNAIIGNVDLRAVDDWTKARAFEDVIALALHIAMHERRDRDAEVVREVAFAVLEIARKGIDEPIANEPKGRTS